MKHSKRFLMSTLLWPIALVSFIGTQVQGQTPVSNGPNVNQRERAQLSSLEQFSSFLLMQINSSSSDRSISKEFGRAWRDTGNGTNGREMAILIFRMWDGSYTAQSQGYTNEYKCCTFKWNPAAIAIVHTHPNCCDPRPGERDREVAEKYGVPNFTLTSTGMYEYDPATRTTNKVLNGLDWMNPSAHLISRDILHLEHLPWLGP